MSSFDPPRLLLSGTYLAGGKARVVPPFAPMDARQEARR